MIKSILLKRGKKGAAHFKSVKGVVSVLITAMLITMCPCEFTNVNAAQVGEIKTKSGRVREKAASNSTVIFGVSEGEKVTIVGEEKGSDGNLWYKVELAGQSGYIRSDLVTKTKEKVSESKKADTAETKKADTADTKKAETTQKVSDALGDGIINTNRVRIRTQKNTSSAIAGVVNNGQMVRVKSVSDEGGARWVEVELKLNGQTVTGYISGDYVRLTDAVKKAAGIADNTQNTETKQEEAQPAEEKKAEEAKPAEEKKTEEAKPAEEKKAEEAKPAEENKTEENKPAEGNNGEVVSGPVDSNMLNDEGDVVIGKRQETDDIGADPNDDYDDGGDEVTASIKGNGVRIRTAPVNGDIVAQLSSGHPVNILEECTGSDALLWYKVSFSYLGSQKEGYVRSDLVNVVKKHKTHDIPTDGDFEALIQAAPESYKDPLRVIHSEHPNWKITLVDTGLDWNDAMKAQSSVGKNLVSKYSITSWKSTAVQSYSYSTNTWYTFDGGSWVSASPELIAYYMDPRNFLDSSGIYQFETLNYSDNQTSANVSKILANTFMSGDYSDTDGQTKSYAQTFCDIGAQIGVSPYLLAARCVQEQGVHGRSQSISGAVSGYQGFFNYFNIGAFAYGGNSATINGLRYAQGTDENYLRPWNSRYRAIYGGAKYLAEKYVSKGQNTLYFQKFNVVNSENGIYNHQYMNNLQAASSESARLMLATNGTNDELSFRIPFYRNMPDTPCVKPTSDSNPNTYLASLNVGGYGLVPAFSGVLENYIVNVDKSCSSIDISATPAAATSSVGGVGTYQVNSGSNTFYVVCKAQNGAMKTYTIVVNK